MYKVLKADARTITIDLTVDFKEIFICLGILHLLQLKFFEKANISYPLQHTRCVRTKWTIPWWTNRQIPVQSHNKDIRKAPLGIALPPGHRTYIEQIQDAHCVKSVQIRSSFWSVFSCIWTEYGDLLRKCSDTELFLVRIFLYSDWIQENTDQK